jgi:hypothetical protein
MVSGADVLKPYKNKEWLDEQINVLGKSKSQVARECGVSPQCIWFYTIDANKKEVIYQKRSVYSKTEKRKMINKRWRERNEAHIKTYNDGRKIKNKIWREENKVNLKLYQTNKKVTVFNILGGCECAECGDKNMSHLTIDHIDSTGHIERKNGLGHGKIYSSIYNGEYPEEKLSNLRVLCWNHNCGRRRSSWDLPSANQTTTQRAALKLWKEAFAFFGPCHCGESELKFLTISHIHNDGAERRRKGEGTGVELIRYFQGTGWDKSLKEDFCLECWNCNCSRGNREE